MRHYNAPVLSALRVRHPGLARAVVVVIGLAVVTCATRIGSSAIEVIDWDESTFMLVAQSLLRGHLPYDEVFDIKPPVLFFLLAAAMRVWGESLLVVRLVGDVCVFGVACATYLVARGLAGRGAALAAAALLVAAASTYFGRYTSTEWPAAFASQMALALMCRPRQGAWSAAGAGAALALAAGCRTNYAVVALGAGFAYAMPGLLGTEKHVRRLAVWWNRAGWFALGGVAALGLIVVPFAARGDSQLLVLGAVTAPLAYATSNPNPVVTAAATLGNLLGSTTWRPWAMGPLVMLAAIGLRWVITRSCADRPRAASLTLVFGVATGVSIALNGHAFSHHLVMLLPAFGVLAAAGIESFESPIWRRRLVTAVMTVVALAVAVHAPSAWRVATRGPEHDHAVRRIADRLAADVRPGDRVWALSHHILLFYLDIPPVSPLVAHPGNFSKPEIADVLSRAGRIPADERSRLIATPPRFVFTRIERPFYMDPDTWKQLRLILDTSYEPVIRDGGFVVYRRRTS